MRLYGQLISAKRAAVLFVMKLTVHLIAYIYAFYFKQTKAKEAAILRVFMVVNKSHLPLSILAAHSMARYLNNLKFTFIPEDDLSRIQKFIIKNSGLAITLYTKTELMKFEKLLKKYKHLYAFFKADWQGKKLLIPLLYSGTENIAVLDPDTLFFAYPKELVKWLKKPFRNIYLKDCDNYTLVSPLEAKSILGKPTNILNVNTGLLGISKLMPKKELPQIINRIIGQIISITGQRRTKIYPDTNPFLNTRHLLEQTIYWLLFEKYPSGRFGDKYFVFSRHLYKNQTVKNPDFIHFAGEKNKKSMYRYLFFSFIEWLYLKVQSRNPQSPWYSYSKSYCRNCWHLKR